MISNFPIAQVTFRVAVRKAKDDKTSRVARVKSRGKEDCSAAGGWASPEAKLTRRGGGLGGLAEGGEDGNV
jgi:hypothetical protein